MNPGIFSGVLNRGWRTSGIEKLRREREEGESHALLSGKNLS